MNEVEKTEVIYADRGRYGSDCDHSRFGSGWGAVGGALVGGGFGAAAVSVWDKINDTKADIMDVKSTVKESQAGVYKDINDKDGYPGKIFNRWLSDVLGKGLIIPWEEMI